MEYLGGPRDGEEVEEVHALADEVLVQVSEFTLDHELLSTVLHVYRRDSFGRITYRGTSEQ